MKNTPWGRFSREKTSQIISPTVILLNMIVAERNIALGIVKFGNPM